MAPVRLACAFSARQQRCVLERATTRVVILEVRDDGKGFEVTGSFPGHLGLHSMRERIESLDGALQIESAPGQGTSIRAHIPTRKTTKLTS